MYKCYINVVLLRVDTEMKLCGIYFSDIFISNICFQVSSILPFNTDSGILPSNYCTTIIHYYNCTTIIQLIIMFRQN